MLVICCAVRYSVCSQCRYEDLPEAKLVLPVILKTQSINVFDGIMDEIEMIEKEFSEFIAP